MECSSSFVKLREELSPDALSKAEGGTISLGDRGV